MAAVLQILDTVDNSNASITPTVFRLSRGGIVTGLTGSASTALSQIMVAVTTAIGPLGSWMNFGGKRVFLRNIVATAVNGDTANVQIIFDNEFVAQSSAYVITYDGYLQAYQTNRIPGTRIPLLVPDWVDPTSGETVKGDLATTTFEYSMRQITVSGIKYGPLPDTGKYDGFIGYANSDTFQGKDPGYWKITRGGAEQSKYSGYYSFHLSAVTKNIEDWSSIHTLYNSKSRIYVKVSDSDETSIKSPPYSYGIIASTPGILRVGPYPTTPYATLFGLGSSIGGFDYGSGDSTGESMA